MKHFLQMIFMLMLASVLTKANAQPGTLDLSFGTEGKTITDFKDGFATCNTGIVQPDDKIIAAGEFISFDQLSLDGLLMVRYNADGSIDNSFGDNGRVITDRGPSYQGAYAIALQADGKIILAGSGNYGGIDILLARYKSDGSIDSSFGKDGEVITNFGGYEYISAMALQPDGKIVVGGSQAQNFLVARYNNDGSLDETFGTAGKVITDFYGLDYATCIALQNDGKIVVGGHSDDGGIGRFATARYNTDGSLDGSYGGGGKVITDLENLGEVINAITIQPDQRIIVAGQSNQDDLANLKTSVVRYNTNGTLDESFGENGITTIKVKKFDSKPLGMLLQSDGKIILGGGTYSLYNDTTDYLLLRLTNNGNIDSEFGVNGTTITDFNNGFDLAHAIGFQKDGKIVLIGQSIYKTDITDIYDLSVARYNNDGNKKQIIIAKIRHWLQHHNGIMWDNVNGVKSYAVQRSADEINWSVASKSLPVPLFAGVIQSSVNYYEDAAPLSGTNYYRLQTTSTNGSINYSNVLAITANENAILAITANENAIKVSPNPAKNILHIEGLSSSNKTKLTVVDFTGNIKLQASTNNNNYNLNIASLTTGNYLLKIEMNNEVVTKKFIKE